MRGLYAMAAARGAILVACGVLSLMALLAYNSTGMVSSTRRLLERLQVSSMTYSIGIEVARWDQHAPLDCPLPPSTPTSVDAVLTYLNTSDAAWRDSAREAMGHRSSQPSSRGEALLAVASILHLAPWVRRIWVVSMDQRFSLEPFAEEVRCKIAFVNHSAFMPAQHLPAFSSLAIEAYIHRIPGLADNYLVFNDDMLLARPLPAALLFSPGQTAPRSSGSGGAFRESRRAASSVSPPRFKALLRPGNMFYPNETVSFNHMYVNTRLALERAGLGPVPYLRWHAPYLLTKAAAEKAWELFGPVLNTTGSHAQRQYRSLDEGGDVNPLMLMILLAVHTGIQQLEMSFDYRMIHELPSDDQLIPWFTLARGPPAAVVAQPPAAAPMAIPHTKAQEVEHRQWQQKRGIELQILFLNFQILMGASDSEFTRVCSLAVLAHASAFNPHHLECLCANAAGVGQAC